MTPDSRYALHAPSLAQKRMLRAALYARVSSDKQQKEGTIESQLAALRRQIANAGHELVREYIDDGYTGKLLARPALEQLRSDLKTDLWEVVYFHAADRIARRAAHQGIIIDELVKHEKQIIINGSEYSDDKPENQCTLTILGAVAEFERAKIIERMMRGRAHHLRKGEMVGGHTPFGYVYVSKTQSTPATLTITEPQAAVVRSMFEMFASGVGIVAVTRWLERNEIKTKLGKSLWSSLQVRNTLECRTYTGNRYYRTATDASPKHKRGSGSDPELICIKVPAIIPQELFDKVQKKLSDNSKRYRQPAVKQLLRGMIECGECGCSFHSYRRYQTKTLMGGTRRIVHKAAYKCNWRVREKEHLLDRITRCHNPEVATHLLEGKVMEMIRDMLLVPSRLLSCIEGLESGKNDKHQNLMRKLERFTERITAIEAQKQETIDLYAAGGLTKDTYIAANRTLDDELRRLHRRKVQIGKELGEAAANDLVQQSIREYCERAKARFEQCSTLDLTRQFLLDHIKRIIYLRDTVTIVGSVPVKRGTFQAAAPVPFRIVAEFDRKGIRTKPRKVLPDDGRWKKLKEPIGEQRSTALPLENMRATYENTTT